MSDQVSFITKNINDILNIKKTWRGSTDIFQAFDENNNIKYLLKEVNFPTKQEDQQEENTIFQDIIRTEDFKKYLLSSEGIVTHNERQFIVFRKEGKSFRKWLKQQQQVFDQRRLSKIVLQFIDIQDLFNRQSSGNFYLADQFTTAFSILENDQLRMIPIRISNQEFKDHVFCKYIKTLTGEEILFPYPPATLEEAFTFDIKPTIIKRGQEFDMYAIGTFLRLVKEMIDEKGLLKGQEDLKSTQEQIDNKSIILNVLLSRMLEINPEIPLSMKELKESLLKISNDGQTELESLHCTNIIQEIKSQVTKNEQTLKYYTSNTGQFLDKAISDDFIEQEKFDEPNGKWNECVLQLLSVEEEKLSKSDKSLLFLSIKKWLDRVMNHFYLQIELEKNDLLQQSTPQRQQQKLNILKELQASYKRTLRNPTGLGLIDFFLSVKQQVQESLKQTELWVSLSLSTNQILKAIVTSKNWKKSLLFSDHILTRETNNIETMLICAQSCLKLKSNEILKYVDLALQKEPKNSSALYFKAKFYQSIKCDSIGAVKYFSECLPQASVEDFAGTLDGNIPYYPTKSKVHYELGKLHWKLNNSEEYMENFKACLSFLEKSKDSNNKHNKMKTNSLKILLLGYLNEMNNKEIQNIKLAQISFVSSSRDPDLCALLSESVLVSRFHPQLAMHFVEQGLQARLFNEDEKLDENSKIQVIPQNFGCLIQQAKINFKIGRNPQNIIDFLLTLKQTIENTSKKQSQLEEEIKDTFKGQPKKGFQVDIDWAYFLNMLLAEMNIEIGNLNKAQDYILPSTKAEKYFKKRIQCEEAHWKAKILLNNGSRQSALELLEENFSYGPSCYLFGIEYFKEIQFQKAAIGLLKATEICPNDTQYLQALANLYWEQISTINAQRFFLSYMEEIQKENTILKHLQKRRLRFPQRKIPFDNLLISRLGRCLFIQGNDRLAQRMLRFSLKIKNSESLTLLWHSEIFFQKKKYAQAKIILEQIPEKDQNNEDYYFFLGMSYIQTENYSIGKEILKKISILSKYKNYYSLIKSLGKASLKEQEFEEAQKYFEQCIQIQDQDSEVFSSLGQCYLAKKDYQNTKIYFLKSLEVNKQNASLFTSLIDIFQILKETPDVNAITNLESNFIQNKTMLNLLGQIFFEAGPKDPKFYTPSEKYFKLSNKLSANVKQPDLYLLQISFLRLAQLAYLQREYAESVKLMQEFLSTMLKANQINEQILQRKGVEYEAYFFLTQLYSYLGENQLERKFIFKCIKMKPENGHLYLKFGFYLLSQQSQAAWKFFEKGMALLKDEDQEQEDILILKSLRAIKKKQTKNAIKLLTKCAMLHAFSEKCLYLLGQQNYQQKQYKQATKFYQNCINMSSTGLQQLEPLIVSKEEKINCFISLGKAHIKVNQLYEASNVMKRCLRLFPQNSKVLAYLSQLQLWEGSTHEASQSASSSIIAGQCDPKIYEILAVTSMRIGNTFQAIQAIEECIKLQPNFKKVQLQLGHIYYSIARPKEALQYYLQYLSCYPKSSQGLVRSSKLLAYFKSFSLAQSHLDRLFVLLKENNKNNPQTHLDQSIEIKHSFSKESVLENEYYLEDQYVRLEDAYAVQGYLWLQQNNFSEALLSYEKAHQKNPKSLAIQFSLAFVCSQLGNFKQEIKIYKQLLKQGQSPKNQLNILLNLGLAYKKAGKIQKSIQTYEKPNIEPSNECSMNLLANLGAFLIESKEYSKAISFLIQVLENDRNHTESLFLLGIAYQNQGLFLDASKFFERSIKSNVWYSPSYLQLSSLKCNLGKLSEAISVCQSALENCHSKERILLFLGNIYFKSNDLWTALATFEQILTIANQKEEKNQLKPNEITILCNLQIARVYRKLNEDEKAIDHLKNSCLNNSPDQPEYLHELGSILIHHKSRQIESLEMLKRAVNACPDNAIYTYSLANALHHLHQYELEIESLKKCLELKSDFKPKIYNNLAIAYQFTDNSTKVLATFKKAIQKFPDISSLYFNLGNYYQSSRKLVQAVESYQICVQKDSTHFEALHNLAVVSVQLKDFQSALNYFSRCLQLNPEQRHIYYPKIIFLLQKGYSVNEI